MSRKYNTILWQTLKGQMTEEEIYSSYFNEEHLSSSEFAALAVNLSPDRYHEIINGITSATDEEYSLCSQANNKIRRPLFQFMLKQPKMTFILSEDDIIMPVSCLIEWAARNKILFPKRFAKYLSASLKHIYIQFQPRNIALREASKYSTPYHKARFQEVVEECFDNSPGITPAEILKADKIINLLKSFQCEKGKSQSYEKRTVEDWITEDHPFPHGRPKKRSKTD
ncbi:MAG: hypothetical protein K2Y01_08185 [Rhabdochlamydiaceae bacterium]|nr:hypothetical protein [Rhabdochlamydiaceae bacterium]